ncbi:hypothetical protein CHS0354_011023 [Potamilus streckersoni]|uniref:Protein kinase domain-containing protein n=1 Tax=Potamilus streckersoni TaxID=2493646 RepID=A0AAE0TKW5_9BIVA|nr:hypothetical protein CHS0354_011023 [Potamilus streckersoni]
MSRDLLRLTLCCHLIQTQGQEYMFGNKHAFLMIHRLDDTDLPSQLLMDMVKEALHPTVAIILKIRRSRSKQHAIAFLIARGCTHLLETKSLIEAQASEGLRKKIKDILLIVLDTKDHTKHIVSEQLKCLSFYKTSDIQNLVAEKIIREGKFTDVCLHYICHKLKRTKVSLHCNSSSRYKQEWATCPGNLGNMRIKAVCFVGKKDGNISNSFRTSRTSSRLGRKENNDYDRDDVDNNLSTLVSLQKKDVHFNLVQLIAYQWKMDPKFFVVEEPKGVKLQEYLLLKRKHNDWLSDLKLIFIVKQALCAVQHLHDRCIVHRDLTSGRFKICPESLTLKLVDFRLAKETSKQDVIVCLNDETRLAIRWTSAESQVSDKYSFRSDVYMLGHLMLEIWTHGCWPFSEHHDKSTDNIMEMVVRGGLKPKQPRCVPNDVFKTMLPTWETEENRISTKELMEDLNNLLEQYSERKGTRSYARQPMDEHYPPISQLQLERNHEPEYGVQTAVLSIKVTKQKHYYNDDLYKGRTGIKIQLTDLVSDNEAHIIEDTQGICTVSEALLPLSIAIEQTIPRLQELENLSGAIKLELNYDNDMHRELVFQYPKGKTLRDVAMAITDVNSLLHVLLNTAKLISYFHNADWIMRSICTFDLWVAEEDTKVFPLRLSRCCAFSPSEDWIIDDVFRDRQNWLPIETLRDEEYTKEGDVYQFAMTVIEVFNILDLRGPEKHLLSSIPFASINKKMDLENTLLRGELPQRPSNCPDMLFAVLERCMSRERIRRPKIQDVLSCIKSCIQYKNEKTVTGIKRQRTGTSKVNSSSEYYVNENKNSIYKDPIRTKHCSDKCEQVVGSIETNDRNGIFSNDQSKYTNLSASKEMNGKENNKISIKDRTIFSKIQNDAEDMSASLISDSSIAESNAYVNENEITLQHNIILNSSHHARIPVPEECNIAQGMEPLSKQKRDHDVHVETEAVAKTVHLEKNRSELLAYTIQKMSKETQLLEESKYINVPSLEEMNDVSEEDEISINEERINWSKNNNVSVKGTKEMYPCVDSDSYSYATKETLPNIFNSSSQARIPVTERLDPMRQRRATLLDQKFDRESHTDVDVRRNTLHLDMREPINLPNQINKASKKAPRLSKFSKLKLRLTRRFGLSKIHSAKHHGDTESRDDAGSESSSNGTRSISSGGSLMFCNDSTSGTSTTSVENEAEDERVYEEITELDDTLFQDYLPNGMTYESDTSDREEQDRFPLKGQNDSPQIKESYAIWTTSIVTENDSPLQSGSMDIHTASFDEARHQDITFENDEIYESTSDSPDSLVIKEGEDIKPLDDREN